MTFVFIQIIQKQFVEKFDFLKSNEYNTQSRKADMRFSVFAAKNKIN